MSAVNSYGSNESIATIIAQMLGPVETQDLSGQTPQTQVTQPDLERILQEFFLHHAEFGHGERDLRQVNAELQEERAELIRIREQLTQKNADLTRNNERLAAFNAALGGNTNQLTAICESITKQLGQFQAATGALLNGAQDVNGQIGQLHVELGASLTTLNASLTVSRELSARLQRNLQTGRQDVAQGFQALRRELGEWRADGSIVDKIRALDIFNQRIQTAKAELTGIQQFALHTAELGHVQADLQQVRLDLKEERTRLARVRREFQKNTEAHNHRLDSQIKNLDDVFESKRNS